MTAKKYQVGLSPEQLIANYELMLLLRRFEEKAGQLYGMGSIGGFCHLYIGQEAVAVGIKAALKKGDSIITSYRDHGVMLSTGSDPKSIMAELVGRATGCSRGKGGSMHMFDPVNGFFGGHGIVGAQVPIGTGLAFASKYNNTDNVGVVLFGDGAANQGQIYEAFNMAKLWKIPVIYIVENNEYAMGTSVSRSSSTTDFYKRGESFGISGMQVDGMSFFAVFSAMQKVVQNVRETGEPFLLEMKTYRYKGHSMSDPAKYRSKEEVAHYREKQDPLEEMRHYLQSGGVLDVVGLSDIEKRVKWSVQQAVDFALESPEPSVEELYTNVYA